jgi:hypothetical protein
MIDFRVYFVKEGRGVPYLVEAGRRERREAEISFLFQERIRRKIISGF